MENKMAESVIVIGSKGVNAIGLIRSLGRDGERVVFASNYAKIESKYTKEYFELPKQKEKWIEALVRYGETIENKIPLFPTDDTTAFLLDENYEVLQQYYIVPGAHGALHKIADKTAMSAIAIKEGLKVAEYKKINVYDEISFPNYSVILKPYSGEVGSKGDIQICRSVEEWDIAIQLFRKKNYSEVMCQQLLDYPNQYEVGIMGISCVGGAIVIPGIIKKIRSYPTGRGSTSYAQYVKEIPEIDLNVIQNFVRSTGFVGLFDIEMIIANGTAWFIEINYRNGQYGFLPTVAGYNLPTNWCRGMRGEKIDSVTEIHEVYYINERDDYLHVKNGEISRKQWMKEFHSASAYGVYCKGDQRPFIRQYVKIPDRVVIKMNNFKKKAKEFFIREEWNIAIRPIGEKRLYQEDGTIEPFKVVSNSFRYWCADPFIITVGAEDYLFFEMFDRFKGKGVIGYRVIDKNGKIGKMQKAYESKHHLSFPFVFEHEGDYYMMPESSYDRNLMLLKAKHFPDQWEVVKTWFSGEKVCDSVMFEKDGDVFLLTQPIEYPYTHAKLNLYQLVNNNWVPCEGNPVVDNSSCARMAGAIVFHKNQRIRPAQNCRIYGDSVYFGVINEVSHKGYSESEINKIESTSISVQGVKAEKFCGIHTYNSSNRYEVIDLKNIERARIAYIVSALKK